MIEITVQFDAAGRVQGLDDLDRPHVLARSGVQIPLLSRHCQALARWIRRCVLPPRTSYCSVDERDGLGGLAVVGGRSAMLPRM